MIVSVYNPDVPFPVYTVNEWWSDNWDPMDYGQDLDLSNPFLEQMKEIFTSVPRSAVMNSKTENCEYSNQINESRNCYLVFGGLDDEDCDYGHVIWNCKDSVDNLYLFKSESCYECVDCLVSTKLFYSQECEACVESVGLFDCRNCLNCIGCVGLVGKSYHIFNKPVSKEEYKEFLAKHPLSDRETIEYILRERDALRMKIPQRSFFGSRNNNVSGNHIYNAHNVHYSFDVKSGENLKFCFTIRQAFDSYDLSFTGEASECYEAMTMLGSSNKVICSQQIVDSHDIFYSEHCYNCDNLFGCYGLRKKSYCILNKQYSRKEYEALVPQIIRQMEERGEWGQFFPKELSPFAYNEAIVNEYMPLSRGEALAKGYKWRDDIPSTSGQETITAKDLPKDPDDYSDQLCKEVLACQNCRKNYRLINREIGFYKKNKLALPLRCFNCRHAGRMAKRNQRSLWSGDCKKCGAKILTSYTPEDQKKYPVYCESCYNKEVY